jgi:hypothetical protein
MEGGARMSDKFNGLAVGDVVRVRDPKGFLAAFSKKIADRDATVLELFVSDWGARARVRFHKRGQRGSEFEEVMRAKDFVKFADLAAAGVSD